MSQHPYSAQIGPFCDTVSAARTLGISEQAVTWLADSDSILAVHTSDGHTLYPGFQFDGHHVEAGVVEVLAIFRGKVSDGWAIADWLTTPAVSLDGLTPIEWIQADRNRKTMLDDALDTAARWSAP